jgi:hypothetical protein
MFTRITDQTQLTFSAYLPPKQINFTIPAYLNITGQYYLSIFPGYSGQTVPQHFIINPGFFGSITSRSPNPLQNASLLLLGNSLWVEWVY